jgi:putative membrane protein
MSRSALGLVVAGILLASTAEAGQDHSKGEKTAGSEAKQEYGEAKTEATQAGSDVRTSAEQDSATKSSTPATGRATTESGKAEQMGSARPESAEVIKKIYAQSTLDAETANIAKEKSQDERVKKFADELARDHKRLGERLEELAKARNVEVSKEIALSSGQKAHVEAMKGMSTAQFEEHFWQMMSQDHGKLLKEIETGLDQANRTGDSQLAAVLQEARPNIEEHQATATSGQAGSSMGTGSAGSAGSAGETPGTTDKPSQPMAPPPSGQRP